MDVKDIRISLCSSSSTSSSSSSTSSNNIQSDEDMMMNMDLLRRGPWTVEEDLTLTNYISKHGDGCWNSLARRSGLNRTGKSCRLRWLNYLRPDVRRGNITLEEQLVILELHSLWGNRWSKIAQHLPGRTDNEIKNYWRTRVQKHAKQLKCDVNSKQFKDTMRYLWMPRLIERIKSASVIKNDVVSVPPASPSNTLPYNNFQNVRQVILPNSSVIGNEFGVNDGYNNNNNNNNNNQSYNGTDNSSTVRSSDSFGTHDDVTRVSDMTELYSTTAIPIPIPVNYNNHNLDYNYQVCYPNTSQSGNYYNPGLELQAMELSNNKWIDYGDMSDNLWNVEDLLFLQQMNIMNTF